MFGRNKKREGYEMIEVNENLPSSSMRNFSSLLSSRQYAGEAEPLVHSEGDSQRHVRVYDASLEHDLESHDVSIQRQTTLVDNRWEHIGNPDQFFTRFYQYHQASGFLCVAAESVFYLFQYLFVIFFATFLFECVDYQILFNNKNVTSDGITITGKRRIQDVIINECTSHFHPLVTASLLFAAAVWIFLCVRAGYHLVQFYEIRSFYRRALGIDDENLVNLTWCEVLALLCQKLPHLHVIITKDRLNELDVYQRILRFKNYFIALVNKGVLPPVLNLPLFGPHPYLSNGLKLNLDFLFFWGPLSPWEKPYTLKEEYKNFQNIDQLTVEMQKSVFILGLINLLFMPLIFAYQVLYIFFSYVELVKRDPSAFGKRRYSNYGRNKLRHFNELDHELQIRLSRSHKAATCYMNLFTSPFVEVVAKNIKFVAGSIFAVFFALAAWDEDFLTLEHALTLMTMTFLIVIICNSCINNEEHVYLPEQLMKSIISFIHYAPVTWEGKAHTQTVRKEFDHIFPLTAQYILEELFSPLLTPFILLFWMRPRAQQFVEFFNRYTVSIEGLGDVCSFAQMDFARHGDPKWSNSVLPLLDVDAMLVDKEERDIASDGKTELSLLHFATMNPGWEPPAVSASFINDLKSRAEKDALAIDDVQCNDNLLLASINSLIGSPCTLPSFHASSTFHRIVNPFAFSHYHGCTVNHLDGPPAKTNAFSSSSGRRILIKPRSVMPTSGFPYGVDTVDAAGEMGLSTTYLRQLVSRNEVVEDRICRGHSDSNIFAESSCIWGVPALDSTESTFPVLFEHRMGAAQQ